MAGLVNTYLQDLRIQFPNNLDRDEWRFTRYGLVESIKEQTNSIDSILSQDLKQKALESEGRALEIPVMKKGAVTLKNVRSCNIGSLENETDMVSVTWKTVVADLSMKKAEYHKNQVSYLQDFGKKMQTIEHAFLKAIEDDVYASLDNAKSGVYASSLVAPTGAKYGLVGDSIQVGANEQELFFNDVDVILNEDNIWNANYQVLASTTLMSPIRHYLNQGAGNDERIDYQFGAYSFRFSNQVVNGAGKKATGFIMPNGSIGFLSRINIDAKMGNKTSDGTTWEVANLPTLGLQVGVMHKSTCSDLSGTTGLEHLKASMVENFQFSFDYAIVTPYNSDPSNVSGTIKKFEFA